MLYSVLMRINLFDCQTDGIFACRLTCMYLILPRKLTSLGAFLGFGNEKVCTCEQYIRL